MLSSDYNLLCSTVIVLNNFIQYSHCQVVQLFRWTPLLTKALTRAGLNEREAPGKVVTAMPPKHLGQQRSVSHALFSTLQKHRSKTSKLIQFGSLHFGDNWGWPCTAVRMWLICSNRKLYHKKAIFLLPGHYTTIFFVIGCLTTFTVQIVHSHMYWGKICLHQARNQLLDTRRGRRVFWEGPKFFKLCPQHFSRKAKTFQGGLRLH